MQGRIRSYLRILAISLSISVGFVWLTCFLNGCPLTQAFAAQETSLSAWLAVWANGYLAAACGLALVMNHLPLPTLPGGPWKREQLIVCRYSGLAYSGISLLCAAAGVIFVYGAYHSLTARSGSEVTWGNALALAGIGLCFFAMGGALVMYMKNYMIIFFPQGVFYQNIFRRTYVTAHDRIEYVSIVPVYRKRSFRLHTADRELVVNRYCSGYHEAESYARSHYANFDAERFLQGRTRE